MDFRPFKPNRPFDIKKWPGYYGWVILVVGTLGMISAVPGSPPGMSVFVDDMIGALDLERSSFALAYTLGTIAAGVCAPIAGRFIDRLGARVMGCLSYFGLGLILLFTGYIGQIYSMFPSAETTSVPYAFILIFISFAGIRLMGVSFSMTTCRSMVFRWFEGKRGWAAAINGTMLSLSFSTAPLLLNGFVISLGWQRTWITLGCIFIFGMTTMAYVFFRDSPEACGVEVEQSTSKRKDSKIRVPIVKEFTAPEALRTSTFWYFVAGLALNGLIGTGISFHIIGLGDSLGMTREAAVGVFLPSSFFHIGTTILIGSYAERLKMKHVLSFMVIAQLLSLAGAYHLSDTFWRWCFIVGSGCAWGSFGVLVNVPWARFYGRKNLGAINGWVTGVMIVTSALGPYLFGLCYELTDAFSIAIIACSVLCPIVFIFSLLSDNPQAVIYYNKKAKTKGP
ncbi:MFS transporter [Coraliomargarita sp. SDUM461003]|uniref:MFS transporter n=1 Tax=Thalassobacterium maritimum TaxID=3041265 RepID=A0ABU1ATR8_9BACT|nr:MFS transporter [Coraliomargarita sp. SDUM461003]MDQ8207486.1 MFS transporter [Coraliomargarita sp. SDUM461003]